MATPPVMAQKRRKYSKKKKSNLRKYTDVRDVEEYLEEVSKQEKTGGIVADKRNEELFTMETTGAADITGTTRLPRKRVWKPLTCERNLLNTSKISPVAIKQTKLPKNMSKNNRRIVVPNKSVPMVTSKDQEILSSVAGNTDAVSCRRNSPWITSRKPDDDSGKQCDSYYDQVTGKTRAKRPRTMEVHKKASGLPALEVAHPGASYNPTFVDHQDLLFKAVGVEVEKQKKIESLERTFSLSSMTKNEREATWHHEMTFNLYEGEGEESAASDDGEVVVKTPVSADKKKTKKGRRKEAERKLEDLKRRMTKKGKVRVNELYRLKSIVKEIKQEEASFAKKMVAQLAKKSAEKFTTKRLGSLKYFEPDTDVQLSEEIRGSLRQLKPEGNIALERLRSFEKRNIIEPRKRVLSHRKYKLKEKEKWSCK